jgi:hypothetical protein
MRRELGEWEFLNRVAGQVLLTPARREALIPNLTTGRGFALMVSRSARNSLQAPNVGTSVYLYYDRHDTLIYVGITDRGIWRNREHDATAEWWPFVARQEVEHLATREAALQREKLLIIERRPPFNRQHNPDYAEHREAYLAWQLAGGADADPEELVRSLNRNLPLVVMDIGIEGRFALKTLPEHSAIAQRFDDLTGTLVLGPKRIGRVVAQQSMGVFAFLLVEHKPKGAPAALGSVAVAPIRRAGDGRFRLAQIDIAPRGDA